MDIAQCFIAGRIGIRDNTDRQQVENFLKPLVFRHHFLIDAIQMLASSKNAIADMMGIQQRADIGNHALHLLITLCLALFYQLCNLIIFFLVQILKAQILQLVLDITDTKTVCNRGIDLQCFRGYFLLLFRTHILQCAHIVEAVCQLDQYNSNILCHSNKYLTMIAGEIFFFILEFQGTDFCDRLYQRGDFLSEHITHFLNGNVTVLHNIMQKACRNRLWSCTKHRQYVADLYRMNNIRLPAFAVLPCMIFLRTQICSRDQIDIFFFFDIFSDLNHHFIKGHDILTYHSITRIQEKGKLPFVFIIRKTLRKIH